MTDSRVANLGNVAACYRLIGPGLNSKPHPNARVHVYIQDYTDTFNHCGEYLKQYATSSQSSIFVPLMAMLNANNTSIVALQLGASCSSRATSFSTAQFLEQHFKKIPNDPIPDPAHWNQWLSVGVPEPFRHIWEYLACHQPSDDLETMTIVSSQGYVIYSILGTSAIFTPSAAVVASSGSVWQLSTDGSIITECSPCTQITEQEVIDAFCHLYQNEQVSPDPVPTAAPTRSTKRSTTAVVSKSKKKPTLLAKTSMESPRKKSTETSTVPFADQTESMDVDSEEEHDPANVRNDSNPVDDVGMDLANKSDSTTAFETMDEDRAETDAFNASDSHNDASSDEEDEMDMDNDAYHYYSSKYSITEGALDESSDWQPESAPHYDMDHDYTGPHDHIVESSCMIISGLHRSIGSNKEIAQATHAMMSAAKIKHQLKPQLNKFLKPEFHPTCANICGYYPLELAEKYCFNRYLDFEGEKPIFSQLKFQPNKNNSFFYHHCMAYAVPVSAEQFSSARLIGAFRGVIPNSNFIPLQIQELHRTVFNSDRNVILFPNVIGTNIAGTHDAKYLHETVIMVKCMLNISITDILQQYKLNRNPSFDIFPTPVTFYSDVVAMTKQLKLRPNTVIPSSVIVRRKEADMSFDVLNMVHELRSCSSLPWDKIAAIIPMDFTSKSARTIETEYVKWHTTDHILIVHKDGSDQRELQKALQTYLNDNVSSDFVARCERYMPGCLDKVFRKYAGIDPSPTPPNQNQIWTAQSSRASTAVGGRSWASVTRSAAPTKPSPPGKTVSTDPPIEERVPKPTHTPASTPSHQHVSTLEAIIAKQAAMIASLEQRILQIESKSLPETQAQLIQTAVTTAVAQFTSRIESSIAQQTQLISQLVQSMQDRKGGASTISTHPPQLDPLVPVAQAIMASSVASPNIAPHWIPESLLFKALQTWCPSPYIPAPLITSDGSFTASSVAAIHEMLHSHHNSDVMGVVFAGNRHWQPVVFKPASRQVTLYDVPCQLQYTTQQALASALPTWHITIESLHEYSDGDCGVVAVEVLLSVAQKCDWKTITAQNLQNRRTSMEQLQHHCHDAIPAQYIGGSWIHSSASTTPISTLPPSHHGGHVGSDDSVAPTPSIPTENNHSLHSHSAYDDMNHNTTCIGTMEGTDIRMATFNINALHEDKLPFLAWLFITCKLDILCIQDTRISRDRWKGIKNIAAEMFPANTLFLHASPASSVNNTTSPIGGVAIIVSARCCTGPSFRGDPLECGSICSYSFNTTLGRILIICTYFPMRSPELQGSLWYKLAQSLHGTTALNPLQHLMLTADTWSALEEASAGTFLLGDLNASIGLNTTGGCHNIQA